MTDYWQGKIVAVTGGAAGLGRAVATGLAEAGATPVLIDRDEGALAQAVDVLRERDLVARGMVADITVDNSVNDLFRDVGAEFGRLDGLVNCAGRSARAAIRDTTPEMFEDLWQLNFLGTVRCARAALDLLVQSQGHLVNIGSLGAKVAARHLGAYPVSKFSVAAYSHQLRMELGPLGLHVLLVCPGPIARPDAGQRYADQAAGLPESASKPGGGVRVKGIEPAYLVERIMRACERRQPELILPAKARLLFAIAQIWPSLGDRIVSKMT